MPYREIFDKIDHDHDTYVVEQELMDWIKKVQTNYITQDTDRQWREHEPDDGGRLTFDSYKKRTYGHQNEGTLICPHLTRIFTLTSTLLLEITSWISCHIRTPE